MLTIKSSALDIKGIKSYYHGTKFNGVALTIEKFSIVKKSLFVDGEMVGDYQSPYINFSASNINIVSELLDDEYSDCFTYHGDKFNGVAYFFINEVCVAERKSEYGWVTNEVTYFINGYIESIDVGDFNVSQECTYFEDGSIQEFKSFNRENYDAWFKFTSKDVIRTLNIEGNYFDSIKNGGSKLILNYYNNVEELLTFKGADFLFVCGDGITEDLFEKLLMNNVFDSVSKLSIYDVRLTSSIFSKLSDLKQLKELIVNSEDVDINDLHHFKSLRKDCYVKFNRKEIVC